MTFTAVSTYESPTHIGPPLAYTMISEVTLQRPDKLRVITPGDGPASEFYYDGKTMMAYMPAENLVAVAEAPPTIDGALKAAYDSAAIYFPFTDVIVADPYQDIADGLKHAFVIGQSRVVGGTTTDMVAIVSDRVFGQVWIGADDKLPRMLRAVYADDPSTTAPPGGIFQLAPGWPDFRRRLCVVARRQRAAHPVRPPGPSAPAGRRGLAGEQTVRDQITEENTMKKVVIGLTSLLITGFLCAPAAAWYHAGGWGGAHWQGNRSSWSAEGFRGTASGGMGPGAPVAIAAAAHLVATGPGVALDSAAARHPVATAPGAAPAIAAAQRPAGMDRGTPQARKEGPPLVGTATGMGPAPMARRPMAGTIAITVEPMRRITRRQR